jgi:transcription elongation factor Elf1
MDLTRLVDSSLSVECPHCGHTELDDYEVIEIDIQHDMHCIACGRDFQCTLRMCRACGAESLFSWTHRTSDTAVGSLICLACSGTYTEDEAPPVSTD